MKKRLSSLVLLLILTLPFSGQAKNFYTVQEIKAQAHEREITIDVMLQVPDVDKVPVYLCQVLPVTLTIPPNDPLWQDGQRAFPGEFLVSYGPPGEDPAGILRVKGEYLSAKPWPVTYDGFSPDTAYIPGNPITFEEIGGWLLEQMKALGLDPGLIDVKQPDSITSHAYYGAREDEFLAPGWARFNWPQLIDGIPVWGRFHRAFLEPDFLAGTIAEVTLTYRQPDLFSLGGRLATPIKKTAEETPLIGFEAIIAALEGEIAQGRLRRVIHVKLGYALFEDRGFTPEKHLDFSRFLYAFPVWHIGCIYVRDAAGQAADVSDPYSAPYYREILVNAQTGELINPLKPSVEAVIYP